MKEVEGTKYFNIAEVAKMMGTTEEIILRCLQELPREVLSNPKNIKMQKEME